MKSNDPKAQIQYQELEFGNYMLFNKLPLIEEEENPTDGSHIRILEFDGRYTFTGSKAKIVLISPKGEMTHLTYKFEFKNTTT